MTNATNTAPSTRTPQQLELEAIAYGNTNQRERYAAGVLPEDELLGIVRPLLFNPFHELPRWSIGRDRDRMVFTLRKQHEPCDNIVFLVDMETTAVAELTAAEWDRLKTINAAAEIAGKHPWISQAGSVAVRTASHWVTCMSCKAEVVRSSAKVTIQWAGRALVREYAL